ncbi:MAG: carbohydrate ABC transporter substrate-binding protein [Clostridia bacterium]|nr:carbohydrate ABC transporter substrate-binding protein [Clostridia bacterium]
MKKTLKNTLMRIVLLSMVLIMTVGCFVSCGDDDTPDGTTPGGDSSVESLDAVGRLPDLDLDGKNVYFLIRKYAEYYSDLCVDELTVNSSTLDRAVYNRLTAVESLYNVNLSFITANDDEELYGVVSTTASNGDATYDIIVQHGAKIFEGAMSGFYKDWNDLKYVDLTADYWLQSAVENFSTPGGKLFAMNGDISYGSVGNTNVMFFNKTILEDAHLDSPYDLVDNETWTLENFIKLAKDADATLTNGNDAGDLTDAYGYITQRYRGPGSAIAATGGRGLKLGNDGKYTISLRDERAVTAFATYRDFLLNSGAAYYSSEDITKVRPVFNDGRAVFTDDNLKCAVNLKDTGIDFGIVPWPKYEESDEYFSVVGSGTNTFAVLKTVTEEQSDVISAVLEAMAVYGQKDVMSYYFDTVVSYQAAPDVRCYEMIQLIHSLRDVDITGYLRVGGIADIGRLIIEEPARYGTSLTTAVSVMENLVYAGLEVWYALDNE